MCESMSCNCIEIETVKSLPEEDLGKTSNGKRKALWVTKFNIDIAKCCYCQLCVFPCPTECIYMTDVYEFSEYERSNLVYNFVTLTPDEIEQKKDNYAKLEAEKAAQKAAAAAAKAAEKAKAESAAPKPDAAKKPSGENKDAGSNGPEQVKQDNNSDKKE